MSIDYGSQGTAHTAPDYDELSNRRDSSEPPNNIPDHLVFEEDDEEDIHLSLQDIVEQLEAWVVPNTDGDFYDLREHLFTFDKHLHD